MSAPQSADNHASMVPMYHYVAVPLIAVPTIFFMYRTATAFSLDAMMLMLFSVGAFLAAFYARIFPLGVQDRVIRLEERLRLASVLPAEMHDQIEHLSTDVLIGLRFAPADELEDLVRRVSAGELKDRKAVKAAIGTWRADEQRI